MTVEGLAVIIGTLVALLVAAGGLIAFIINFRERFARLELKVETLWSFQMRRAMIEGIDKNVASLNSPLTIDEKRALEWFNPEMIKNLRDFYNKLPKPITDNQLALEIEKSFGKELVLQVSIPYKLEQGSCLLMAVAISKRDSKLIID